MELSVTHSFCNQKVRENKNQISVITHNLFGSDSFFFLKGLRLGVLRTRNVSIEGTNLTNINFANISNQIKFIDTLKYYQQILSVLTSTMTREEIQKIKNERKKFVENDQKLSKNIYSCSGEDREWDLNYLSSEKGTIPYEMITIPIFQKCNLTVENVILLVLLAAVFIVIKANV